MHASGLHYFPISWPLLILLIGLYAVVVAAVTVRLIKYASAVMGIGPRSILALLLLSLLGSYINIPVAYLPARELSTAATVTFFGITYMVPVVREWPATVLAVNVGGAVIPVLLSVYLMAKNRLYGLSIAGTTLVAVICHLLAHPVPGLGIAEPVIVPPLATAVVALLLAGRQAAPLAYISGSLGTLIGADLLNLDKIQGLGTPIASIGGAGTFDGIFLNGMLAVLYAGLAAKRKSP